MQIPMTLGERIKFAERLPKNGTLHIMNQVKGIRQKLVGFTAQQKTQYLIVEDATGFHTENPDTRIAVTLTDDMIKVYADIIRSRSAAGTIDEDEAIIFETIVAEADRLAEAEAEAQQGDGEGE
jgi:hypothetical protein